MEKLEFPERLFITGIGTDVGKSYATGWLAREMRNMGLNVITQKLIQTGNLDMSEDIEVHRKIMGIPLQPVDEAHVTAPIILSYPCSPDLAAKIDGVEVDFTHADKATETLLKNYSNVLIEGAGGIFVPLKGEWLQIDYVKERNLPVAIVVNGQLGSINHALLTLESCRAAGVKVFAVIYNPHFDADKTICEDTRQYLRNWLKNRYEGTAFIEMPKIL